ncbi:DivIVA domain-containing protein [Actinomadura kijaniata]|uniref:DivIVA domain-containing protein n=1 Tax=Actinomadura kijaniata TaxID=46161 RepID=UPI00082A0B28|nr:DivIVA domain-containing protein [Actinomadura kijaniata]
MRPSTWHVVAAFAVVALGSLTLWASLEQGARADRERARMRSEGVPTVVRVSSVTGGKVRASYRFAGRSWTMDLPHRCELRGGGGCPAIGTPFTVRVDPRAPGHTMTEDGRLDDLDGTAKGARPVVYVAACVLLTGAGVVLALGVPAWARGRPRPWPPEGMSPQEEASLRAVLADDQPVDFTVRSRGYDRDQVDGYFLRFAGLLDDQDRPPLARPVFATALRGYDRAEVDACLDSLFATDQAGGTRR